MVIDIVIIKEEEINRGHWKISTESQPDIGNIVRVAQLRIGKNLNEQRNQLLHSLELHCKGIPATKEKEKKNEPNPFPMLLRPKRTVAETTKWCIKDIVV